MKIKAGLCVGYNGTGYSGLQYNRDLNTIEKTVAENLYLCKGISKQNASDPSKIHFKSSSRTDKGVHAAFNLICCKIECEITEDFFEKLKTRLLTCNIYLYKILRLTKSFLPTKFTSSRIYEYVVPTFFLQESNFENEINKMIEEDTTNGEISKEDTDKNVIIKDDTDKNGIVKDNNGISNINKSRDRFRKYEEQDLQQITGNRASKEDILIFEKILNNFLGTKNFHNFTTASNPKGKERFIKSIKCTESYTVDNIEYIRVTIEGQSFLLHQIRKMMYFAILLCRYKRTEHPEIFSKVFSKEYLHVPKGPGQYLLLDSPIFMELRNKGKMTDTLEVNEDEKNKYKTDTLYKIIHDKTNLYYFLACLDSSRFYNDKLNYLK